MYFLFSIWKNQPNTMQFQFRDQNFYSDILQLCRTCAKIYSLAFLCHYCFLLSSSSIHGNSKSTPQCSLTQNCTFIYTLLPPTSILTTNVTATFRFLQRTLCLRQVAEEQIYLGQQFQRVIVHNGIVEAASSRHGARSRGWKHLS